MTEIYKTLDFGSTREFRVPETVQKLSYNAETGEINTANATIIRDGWFDIRS